MKRVITIFLIASCFTTAAQPVAEQIYFGKKPLPDSTWKQMSDDEKLEYCRFNAESYRQLCGRLPFEIKRDSLRYIYFLSTSPHFFGEYHYSKRQQEFIKTHTGFIERQLRHDLLDRQNGLYNWNYLLLYTPPTPGIIRVLLDDYNWHGGACSDALSVLIQYMDEAGFTGLRLSEPYRQLMNQESPLHSKIPHTYKNGQLLAKLASDFADSLQMAKWFHGNTNTLFYTVRPVEDSIWKGMTVREKIFYCLRQAESYRQICSFYAIPPRPETNKFIYAENVHLVRFGEYEYSNRQLNFLTAHLDSVEAYLEEDLFLNKSNLFYWDYLLRQLPARREILDLLLEYWRQHETATSEPLNLIISLMIRDGFEDFLESSLGKVLHAGSGKIPYHANNREKLGILINEYMRSQHVGYRGHWNRISDSQIFSAVTRGDSLYTKTRRIGDVKLNSLSALQLLNYCIFNPELYFQICSNAGRARRNYHKYIYADFPAGNIDQGSYSQRQKNALLKHADSCQILLMELLQAGDMQEGLILLTNTWQAIPWLVKRHRMYGSHTGSYITTLLALLGQNKGTGFDDFIFEREAMTADFVNAGHIKKTPASENVIIRFAMDLYRLKKQRP